eukprot:gnl/MRDRNA2_/MRDRNA2_125814_c0_seq1.p1 gnl/MRDRNA2_/MRDRNA2_125814_c0~~gnl/MRDRNA2_/MRDRNA2_125814_c0_seq1.p1  ORF type:complete len:573 (+),score=121.42 gnl/MRDRNA2_/MRDRNA2_125814_c0_seq1:130-1848(+)
MGDPRKSTARQADTVMQLISGRLKASEAAENDQGEEEEESKHRRSSISGSDLQAQRIIDCLVRIHMPLHHSTPVTYSKERRQSKDLVRSPSKEATDIAVEQDESPPKSSASVSKRPPETIGKPSAKMNTADSVLSILRNIYNAPEDKPKDQASRVLGLLQGMFADKDDEQSPYVKKKSQQVLKLTKDKGATDGVLRSLQEHHRRSSAELNTEDIPSFPPASSTTSTPADSSTQALLIELGQVKAAEKKWREECTALREEQAKIKSDQQHLHKEDSTLVNHLVEKNAHMTHELESVKSQVRRKDNEIERLRQGHSAGPTLSSEGVAVTQLQAKLRTLEAQKDAEIQACQASMKEAQRRAYMAEAARDAALRRSPDDSKPGNDSQELRRVRQENEALLAQITALNKENAQLLREAKETREKLRAAEVRTKQGDITAIQKDDGWAQAKLQYTSPSPTRSQFASPNKDSKFSFDTAPAEVGPRSASRPRSGYEALGLDELRQLNDALLEIKRENTALLRRLNGGSVSPARGGSPLRPAVPRDGDNADGAEGGAWPWQSPARRILAFRPKTEGADGP